jgi:hypothetical protein
MRNTPPRDFAPTLPPPPLGEEDPHTAGLAAQQGYIEQCKALGVEPSAAGLEDAYWSVYRTTSQWGDL